MMVWDGLIVQSSRLLVPDFMATTLNFKPGTWNSLPLSPAELACRILRQRSLPFKDSRMAILHITDASGRAWQLPLSPQDVCTIGRAPDNRAVLNDPRASRYHA